MLGVALPVLHRGWQPTHTPDLKALALNRQIRHPTYLKLYCFNEPYLELVWISLAAPSYQLAYFSYPELLPCGRFLVWMGMLFFRTNSKNVRT